MFLYSYLERPSEGRMITMNTNSTKHLCIVIWFSLDLRTPQHRPHYNRGHVVTKHVVYVRIALPHTISNVKDFIVGSLPRAELFTPITVNI